MSVRSERFNRRVMSLDVLGGQWLEKARVASDKGLALERMLGYADYEDGILESPHEQAVGDAAMLLMFMIFLVAGKCEHLAQTLEFIWRNGCDEDESIRQLRLANKSKKSAATRLYQLHRHQLQQMFIITNRDSAFLDLENPTFRFGVTEDIEGHDGGEVPSQEPLAN